MSAASLRELPNSTKLKDLRVDTTTAVNPLVVVDRLVAGPDIASRLADAVGTAFAEGDGDCVILVGDVEHRFTERFECPNDGTVAQDPTPQLFSFNNPRGACPTCNGFGAVLEYDESLIVADPSKTLSEGAIDPWEKPRYDGTRRTLADFARREKIPLNVRGAT